MTDGPANWAAVINRGDYIIVRFDGMIGTYSVIASLRRLISIRVLASTSSFHDKLFSTKLDYHSNSEKADLVNGVTMFFPWAVVGFSFFEECVKTHM